MRKTPFAGLRGAAAVLLSAVALIGPSQAQQSPGEPWRERNLSFTGSYLSALVAESDQETQAAAGFLSRALARDPNDPVLITQTFTSRLMDGDVGGGLPLARRLLQLDKPTRFVLMTLSLEAMSMGKFDDAAALLARDVTDNPIAAVTDNLLLAWIKQGQGDTDGALQTLQGFNGPPWYSLFANYHSGLIAAEAGRMDDAIGFLAKVREANPSSMRMTEAYIRVLANAGDLDGAKEIVAEELAVAPHPILEHLSEALAAMAPAPPAAPAAEPATTVTIGRGESLWAIALRLYGDGNRYTEIHAANRGQIRNPDIIHPGQVLVLPAAGPSAAPVVVAEAPAGEIPPLPVADATGGAAEVLYTLGSAIGSDAPELSTIYLSLALFAEPSNEYAAFALAELMQELRRYERSAEAFGSIPEASPFHAAAEVRRALSLDALDETDIAVTELKALVEEEPDDATAAITLADILSGRERFGEATEFYTKAIDLIAAPETANWVLYYRRGVSYERTGQWPLGEADFFRALEISPDRPEVLNYLGYTWADRGENLDRALGMIQKAVDLRPNDGYIVDSLGWAHYMLGNYEDAVTHLERAVTLSPQDVTLNDHLGDAYWQVGRKREAVFQWTHARDLGAEGDALALIADKIANGLPAQTPEENKVPG